MARKKPKPEYLGTGGAAKAGKKLQGRKSQLDEYERKALKGK